MKRIILIGIIVLLLVGGCVRNRSSEICGVMKHSPSMVNNTVYMEEGTCIIEEENYNSTYFVYCKSFFEQYNLIIKGIEDEPEGEIQETIKEIESEGCKVEELE